MTPHLGADLAELAVVTRTTLDGGEVVESRHLGSLVALDAAGEPVVQVGDHDGLVLPRSTAKPVQALACLHAGADLIGEELAIAAGSHTGTDTHVAVVRRILERAGLDESALRCPADRPEDAATRDRLVRSGTPTSPLRMNCSGKHAAMLLACRASDWDTTTYLDPEHPLQQQVRATLEGVSGVAVDHVAVDGCGAPLLSTTLAGLARALRGLVTAADGTLERRVADAMRAHPFFVGGEPHPNSDTMIRVAGSLAKGGAEGVLAVAAATGEAVALKVVDGSPRATTAVALHALGTLGVDTRGAGDLVDLPVLGGGARVGSIRPGSGLGERWVS